MSFTGERYVPELRGQIYYEHFHRYAMVLELARDTDRVELGTAPCAGFGGLQCRVGLKQPPHKRRAFLHRLDRKTFVTEVSREKRVDGASALAGRLE
jgi:hypothetical protein